MPQTATTPEPPASSSQARDLPSAGRGVSGSHRRSTDAPTARAASVPPTDCRPAVTLSAAGLIRKVVCAFFTQSGRQTRHGAARCRITEQRDPKQLLNGWSDASSRRPQKRADIVRGGVRTRAGRLTGYAPHVIWLVNQLRNIMARPSNTDERRLQIMGALVKVMAKRGYDGASVADIARAARLTPGLVHYHFKNKQEILLAALRDLVARRGEYICGSRIGVRAAARLGQRSTARVDGGNLARAQRAGSSRAIRHDRDADHAGRTPRRGARRRHRRPGLAGRLIKRHAFEGSGF